MTPTQLYTLVKPDLLLLDLTNDISLCHMQHMFVRYMPCATCPYYNDKFALGHCRLDLRNTNAKELKHMLTIKHPELFV